MDLSKLYATYFRVRKNSARDIEIACRRGINAEMSDILYALGKISGKDIFIDGTKIESCANKYTFVWKKAVTKNLSKLLSKIVECVADCEEQYGIKVIYQNQVSLHHLNKLRKKLYKIKKTSYKK